MFFVFLSTLAQILRVLVVIFLFSSMYLDILVLGTMDLHDIS